MIKIDFGKYISDIKTNPGKLFGLVYVYIFTVGMLVGIYYVQNLNTVTMQTVSPGIPDTTTISDLNIVEAKTIPAVNLSQVQNPDQQFITKGKELYISVCTSCHGEGGNGKGPAGVALNPPPRDFSSSEGWKNGQKISDIYKTLQEGIPGTPMISYNYMTPEERIAIAHYIRISFIPKAPPVTPEELSLMDQLYNISKGMELAAQIPVSQAMKIYLTENKSRTEKIINSMREISSDNSNGGMIFRRIISDKAKAVVSLAQHNDWKNDITKFRRLITSGINRNGFNNEVNYLNEDEWNALYNYLSSIL